MAVKNVKNWAVVALILIGSSFACRGPGDEMPMELTTSSGRPLQVMTSEGRAIELEAGRYEIDFNPGFITDGISKPSIRVLDSATKSELAALVVSSDLYALTENSLLSKERSGLSHDLGYHPRSRQTAIRTERLEMQFCTHTCMRFRCDMSHGKTNCGMKSGRCSGRRWELVQFRDLDRWLEVTFERDGKVEGVLRSDASPETEKTVLDRGPCG